LSSTTDPRRGERGQILILFAGGLVFILAVAALVFDVGQNLLDRRTEQNVSDAAALAGAQYADGAGYSYHGFCADAPGGMPAVAAACDIAASSGYVDGTNGRSVRIDLPPIFPSVFAGIPSHIQVTVSSSRPSFFAGVLGLANQNVGAMAVAKSGGDIPLPYSLLALAPHACAQNKITGSPGSQVITNGTVHVDSDCVPDALLLAGNGVLTAPECDVVGQIQTSGGATNACVEAPTGVLVSGDPLRNLPPPPQGGTPSNVVPLDGGAIPAACPGGSSPATDGAPATCQFSAGPVGGHSYRLFPGNYPGGISTSRSTLYLSPGIYWLGGGGLHIQNTGRVISKALGDNTGTTPSGGVLIYNTADPNPAVVTGCVTAPNGPGCYNQIVLNGGAGIHTLALLPIQTTAYKNMVIFVDRTKSKPDDVFLNGSDSELNITGTIYAANGTVRLNGTESDVASAQIICWTFQVNGDSLGLTVNYNPDDLFHFTGVGLVQ
jgi:Flp pilus assembly protein TadG